MNKRQQRTFDSIFAKPPLREMRWEEIESLLGAVARVEERAGSRIAAIAPNGVVAVFHRPHPSPMVGRKTIKNVADFLKLAKIE